MPSDLAGGEPFKLKTDSDEQMGFVRKVLGIVSAQLFFSFIIMLGAAVETSPVSVDLKAGTVTCEHGAPVVSWQQYDGLSFGCMNSFGVFC